MIILGTETFETHREHEGSSCPDRGIFRLSYYLHFLLFNAQFVPLSHAMTGRCGFGCIKVRIKSS